jgi:NAD(P)-dependent dehydrogenase (short-subunit alcohol dehydrogenase family)
MTVTRHVNEHWSTNDIPDLKGKVIIVTGGNNGLGLESVKAFAQKGAEVIIACRDVNRGEGARFEIGYTKGKIVVMPIDLQNLSSVRDFTEEFKKKYKRLDVLLNNAGIMTTPYFLTRDGLEGQMGTNHFGHFALTGHLLSLIKKTPGSRVVNVSSLAHKRGKMDFSNLRFKNGKGYSPLRSYCRSKLANLLFTYELQRRFETNKIESISVASHPGVSRTDLDRHIKDQFWFKMQKPFLKLYSQDQKMGALPQIRAAVDPNVKGGEYYGPHKGIMGYPVIVKSSEESHNEEDARELWKRSEKITGVKYEF